MPLIDNPLSLSRWHRNAYTSPFLRLPPEIRNRIYALVLTVGQIHVRYRPWRMRKVVGDKTKTKKAAAKPTATATDACNDTEHGGFYAVALGVDQDAWRATGASKTTTTTTTTTMTTKKKSPRVLALPDALTPLATVCRQLYRDTAALPFALNAWSFESARLMERYLVREKRLTLLQRRAMAVLVVSVSDDLPSRSMEKYLGGLRAVVWRDGKTVQRWELASAAELQRLVAGTQRASLAARRGALHLYE